MFSVCFQSQNVFAPFLFSFLEQKYFSVTLKNTVKRGSKTPQIFLWLFKEEKSYILSLTSLLFDNVNRKKKFFFLSFLPFALFFGPKHFDEIKNYRSKVFRP